MRKDLFLFCERKNKKKKEGDKGRKGIAGRNK